MAGHICFWTESVSGYGGRWAQTGANAGGLWGEAGWAARTVGLFAHAGRESGRLGISAAGSVSARLGGKHLQMIVTDGCPGLGAAIQTVYPRALHQRCWVHKMRNILEKAKKRDY